jgi:hypothetical protein
MSATEHLSPQQFAPIEEVRNMYSGDFDEPMHRTLANLRKDFVNMSESPHPQDAQHGGPDAYVDHLSKDIAEHGMHSPLLVRGGNVVTEGHHRYVAAERLGLKRVPVEHIQ